jgi:DNA-binding LytR/AlgR family response regulator
VVAEERVPHLLVIDDDVDMLEMLDTILTTDGFRVTACDDPNDGLRIAEAERPDLIVLDVLMPGKSGLDVMREIRSSRSISEVPILFLSAVGDETVVVQGLKGADDYVVKPFKNLELEARIRKILARADGGAKSASRTNGSAPERLSVRIGNETYLVPLDQIFFFEASGKYAYAHTQSRRFLTNYSIGEIEERLGPTGRFMRTHRSHVVNTDFVFKIARDERKNMVIVLSDEKGTELKVSESYVLEVKRRLGL